MRFDLTVNILTNHAYNKGVITIFGGDQQRPNIHIDDVLRALRRPPAMPKEKIAGEIFNAGYQNQTVERAGRIRRKRSSRKNFREKAHPIGSDDQSDDNRSYRITSRKIAEKLGWGPSGRSKTRCAIFASAFKDGKFPGDTLSDDHSSM